MAQLQGAEESGSSERTVPRAASPVKVFVALLLVVVVALGGAAVYLSGREPAGEPSTRIGGAAPRLTDEEAIARFKELWRLDKASVARRDPSLVDEIYTSDSPSGKGAYESLIRYRKDGVFDRNTHRLIAVEVVSNTSDEIELEVVSRYTPCIVDSRGRSVLKREPRVIELMRAWTLRPEQSTWLVYEIATTKDRVVRGAPHACSG